MTFDNPYTITDLEVSPQGEVAYQSDGKLSLVNFKDVVARDVGSNGRALWFGNAWHFIFGATLFNFGTPAGPSACPELLKGDLNGDGRVSLGDVVLTLRVVTGLEPALTECRAKAADVDCSGSVDLTDALKILQQYVTGRTTSGCG